MEYSDFIRNKAITFESVGLTVDRNELSPILFDFQKDLTKWSLAKGKSAEFAGTGLGKSFMQCEWSRHVSELGKVLILAPLAVSTQTVREARKIGVDVNLCRSSLTLQIMITYTNSILTILSA